MIYACLNGEFQELDAAVISVNQSGLYYGTGCFETLLYRAGEIEYREKHYQRLFEGLRWLGVSECSLPDAKKLTNNIMNLLHHNGLSDISSKIRIQCSIDSEQGYSQSGELKFFTFITAEELPVREEAYSLKVVNTRAIPSASRPAHLKLSNMLHFRHAFRNARQSGFQDALMLNANEYVAETSIANIFWIKDDTIFTPSSACDILPGIIRHEVIKYLKTDLKKEVEGGTFEIDELLQADAVWVTNSLMLAKPVVQIDQVSFDSVHPIFKKITQFFNRP